MENSNEKVLIYGMTNNPGGIESYLLALVRRSPYGSFDLVCDLPEIAYRDDLEFYGCSIHFILAKGADLKGHLRAFRSLLEAHPEYRTVYMNVLDAGAAVTALAPRLMKRRVVVHSHNGGTEKNRMHRLLKPLLNLLVSACAACSRVAADYMFTKRNAARAAIVPNMIDVRAFRPNMLLRGQTRAKLGIPEDVTVVLHVGRLSRQKNPLLLADIAAQLKIKPGAYRMLSVGAGEEEQALLERIRELDAADVLTPLGVRSDLPALYNAADVFILPSRYEGLPIVGIEAQAAGLPCILSDKITREIRLTDCVFFLSPEAGPKAWADVIESHRADGRRDTVQTLMDAGYDVSCADKAFADLRAMLAGR